MQHEELPGVLAEIADATDAETAITLARTFGGTEITIPRIPRPKNRLVQLLGQEKVEAIAEAVGWGRLLVPQGTYRGTGQRRATARKMIDAGASTNEVALATGLHERSVRRMKASMRTEQRQHTLFGRG